WYIGDSDKIIQWTANGSIAKVEIAFASGADDPATASYTVISPAGGVDSGEGTLSWFTSNWLNGFNGGVADAKSDKCYIRIRDLNDSTVSPKYSARFTIKPKVTLGVIPTWTAGTKDEKEAHEVTWTIPGAQVSNIRIDLSYDGGNTWPVNLVSGVPSNSSMPYTLPNILPGTIGNAIIKVSDNDPLYAELVNEISNSFKIIGGLILSQPVLNADWVYGTIQQVKWTPYGSMTGNVDLYYKYDGGEYTLSPVASALASSGACDWLIPDHISENVQVKIKDALNPDETFAESLVFNIMAKFDITYPENGNIIIAEDQIDITWNNYTISSLTHVKLEYSIDNGSNWDLITDGEDDGGGSDLLVLNSGSCAWTPADNLLSTGSILRISDPDNVNSTNAGTGLFVI
ncbi:MAG: hypothetical protein KAI91_07420, partial [Candidatus Omnitrophica bacterium]|nr:hypothetical protein [Candidatus Omnitrophota bacterium]